MGAFEVTGFSKGANILLVGLLAGVAFYALNKYVFTPAESALGLPAAA